MDRATEQATRQPRQATRRPGTGKSRDDDRARPRGVLYWPLWLVTRIVLPLVLLVAIGGGIVYVRLLNGPISLKPLAAPIARALTADMPGFLVGVEDVSAILSGDRGLEFRLRNVKLTDTRGAQIAEAPDAAVTLSGTALMSGRIAPSRIVLIEPSLILQYAQGTGVSLSFGTGSTPASVEAGHPGGPAAATPALNAVGALAPLAAALDERAGAAGFVKGLGLRNATVIVDGGGQRAAWRIREADIGVDRRRQGAIAGANLVVDTARGPWQLALVASRKEGDDTISIEARVTGFVPSAMTGNLPMLAALSVFDVPVSGSVNLKVSGNGDIAGGDADLEIGKGALAPGFHGGGRLTIDGGRIKLGYDAAKQQVVLHPSRIESGKGWMTLAGGMAATSPQAGAPWRIEIASTDGMIAPEEFGLVPKPLEAFRLRGQIDPGTGVLDIEETVLRAGGGEVSMTGHVPPKGAPTRLSLKGKMTAMGVDTLKLLWPPVIAPTARQWSGQQIQQGRLTSGTFIVEDVGHGADRGRAAGDGIRVAVSIEGANVRIQPRPGFAPVEAPRVLVRVEGNTLDIAAPEATVITGPQRRLPLRAVRMLANDVGSRTAMGDLTFRAQGPLPPALDIAEQQAARNGRSFALPGEGIDGRIDAQVRIAVPLGEDVHAEDTRLDIRGRVTEGRLKGVFGGLDVNGATLNVEITDQQLDAKGDMLLGGVAAKLVTLKRLFAAPDGEQPPILVSANLDTADRVALGIDINDFVVGEVPVEVMISPRTQGDSQIQVRANLSAAELVIEPLAWKKAPGRPANLQFEIARPSKQRTELQNFRIVGEDISASGSLVLDGRNKLREFSFPELTLHVVSRLQLSGNLRNDNVWDVAVRGQTLDGRDFFKSLYALGQLRTKPPPPRKDQSGLDLKAEIDNVLGHHDLALKGLKLSMSNRGGKTVAMTARGVVEGSGRDAGKPLELLVSQSGREARKLVARTDDAGQAFRLIGFFPNMMGGQMQLDMNLDGSGNAEKTGNLRVRNFTILGDAVSGQPPEGQDERRRSSQARRPVERSRLDFDSMNAEFELGQGLVIIKDADLRGQVLGVVLNGRADFKSQNVHLEGTYVPLQGLNSALGNFPILGIILAGPRGEGVIGMKFDVRGPMARPQINVNPVSIVPGIFREMMKISNPDLRIPAPAAAPVVPAPSKAAPAAKAAGPRGSSSGGAGKSAPSGPQPRVDANGGWSSDTVVPPTPQQVRKQ